jgi:ATP synthase protein I
MGLFAGVYLDRWLHTDPWLTLMGLGLGIAAAFRNIAIAIKKVSKSDRKNKQ